VETITLEAFAWVNRLVGGSGTGRVAVELPAEPGDTVMRVLRRAGERFPELGAALWARSPDEVAEYFVVMVNQRAHGAGGSLDAPLAPGDTVSLLGQYSGG
jgi:molybdopterin converting factor small subunit